MPTTKVQPGFQSSNGHALDELDEQVVIARLGDAIAEAASQRREAIGEDPRQAARRAAVDIATATLSATSAATATHSDDVDVISEGIARRLGVSGQQLEDVMMAARLHDIGKLGVPPSTIEKPGPLNRAEWAVLHRHTIIGEQILLAVPELRGAARLVRYSHERWDGSGYPDGLAGEQIPLGSRIVFCADAFHAIRSDRPYRAGRSAAEALAEIRACAGTQFDPAVVEALMTLSDELRNVTNGARSRSRRAQRLLALMLIVSVGACSSALARSGLMPEPDPSHAPQAAGAAHLGASGTGALGPGGQPTGSRAAADGAGGSSGAINDLRSLTLLAPGLGLGPGADGDAPNPFGIGVPGHTPAAPGSPQGDDRPGVRDHGQGVGRGKGQGKGRGAELGRGHQKTKIAKRHANGSVPRANGAGKGKAKAHAGSSEGNANSSASATAKSKASDAGKAKSNTGVPEQVSTTKPPKSPIAPKPPKATTPPTQTPPLDVAPAPGSGSGNSAAGGTSGGSSGNSSGNGHG